MHLIKWKLFLRQCKHESDVQQRHIGQCQSGADTSYFDMWALWMFNQLFCSIPEFNFKFWPFFMNLIDLKNSNQKWNKTINQSIIANVTKWTFVRLPLGCNFVTLDWLVWLKIESCVMKIWDFIMDHCQDMQRVKNVATTSSKVIIHKNK